LNGGGRLSFESQSFSMWLRSIHGAADAVLSLSWQTCCCDTPAFILLHSGRGSLTQGRFVYAQATSSAAAALQPTVEAISSRSCGG
jgi:hypothetical protein